MNIKLILKGFIVGIGKIIPGVSGSMLAMTLGVYEPLINIITDFTSGIKDNVKFLINFGLGVVISFILFSRIILYLLNNYYIYTIVLFIGLIIGTILPFSKNLKLTKKNIILFFTFLLLLIFISFLDSSLTFVYKDSFLNNIYVIIMGFIDATTMIIPGISGTAIFILLGVYEFTLSLFSNPMSFLFFLYGFGMFIGIIMVSYLMKYLFSNYKDETYSIIMAFSLGSIIILLMNVINLINIPLILILFIGIVIGILFDK